MNLASGWIQGMSEGEKLLAQVTLESDERKDFMETTLVFLTRDSAGAMGLDPGCSPTHGLALISVYLCSPWPVRTGLQVGTDPANLLSLDTVTPSVTKALTALSSKSHSKILPFPAVHLTTIRKENKVCQA